VVQAQNSAAEQAAAALLVQQELEAQQGLAKVSAFLSAWRASCGQNVLLFPHLSCRTAK
jgi:hypothetical protein